MIASQKLDKCLLWNLETAIGWRSKIFCDIAKKFIQSAPKAFLSSEKSSKFAIIQSSRCILFFILTIEVLFHSTLFQKSAFSGLKMSTDMFIHFIEVCVG